MSDKQKVNAINRFFSAPFKNKHLSDVVEMNSEYYLLLSSSQENPLHQLPISQYVAD